jgi:hypothetical protein
MMKPVMSYLLLPLLVGLLGAGCRQESADGGGMDRGAADLTGQWRAQIQFRNGAFASVIDLEFMYVFNRGGTMTESSNYDAAPPVPPAYGIWRKVGPNQFEAKYEYFATMAPKDMQELTRGGGWLPAGRGILTEKIILSEGGDTFTSTIRYDPLDPAGNPTEGGGDGTGKGERLRF